VLQHAVLVLHGHKFPEELLRFLAIKDEQANIRVRYQELSEVIGGRGAV